MATSLASSTYNGSCSLQGFRWTWKCTFNASFFDGEGRDTLGFWDSSQNSAMTILL